jgi:hypothetical protein
LYFALIIIRIGRQECMADQAGVVGRRKVAHAGFGYAQGWVEALNGKAVKGLVSSWH